MNYLEDEEEPSPRKKVFEPVTKYDFCLFFSKITKRPLGLFLKATSHWPVRWFIELQSLCKEKTKDQQAKTINWYVREGRAKEVDK